VSFAEYIPFFGPRRAFREARRDLPAVAEAFGLSFIPGKHDWEVGRLEGTCEGLELSVLVDTPAIRVHFPQSLSDFTLSSWDDQTRGNRTFESGNPTFDRKIRTRKITDPAAADRLRQSPEVFEDILSLFAFRVSQFDAGASGLSIMMTCPWGRSADSYVASSSDPQRNYIRADHLSELLPLLIRIAGYLEHALSR